MSAASQCVRARLVLPRQGELCVSVAILVAGLHHARDFEPGEFRLFPPCPFLWLTGFYCPGCGSLRALHQLLHGNFAAAISFNPFAVLALPFVGYERSLWCSVSGARTLPAARPPASLDHLESRLRGASLRHSAQHSRLSIPVAGSGRGLAQLAKDAR